MERTISVELMRKSDAYTIENFIDSKELMYRAGVGVFGNIDWKERTAIVCGTGNNAGDGYVLAFLLKSVGKYCKLYIVKDKFSTDGRYYFDKCVEAGIDYEFIDAVPDFSGYDMIVDCIYGTGFKGKLKKDISAIIQAINDASAYTVSVDINSGMDADTGESDLCVNSDITVSIGYLKNGMVTHKAKQHIKKLINVDIGIVLAE